jgi:UDP-glucose 4-epimerase
VQPTQRLTALAQAHDNVSFVAGDISEWPALAAVMQDQRPDAVVHCAAIVGVPNSLQAPILTMRVNVEGTMNVLEAMRLNGVKRMVHISSEETYGPFEADIITEDHPQRPLMAYGVSKVAVEHIGRSYAARYGLECLHVRTCWVYGPGLPRPRVPKTLIDAAAQGRPLHMDKGADFLVDHTHVDDVVSGILLVLDHRDHPYDAYHIASGTAVTLAQIVNILKELVPGADLSVGPGTIDFAPGVPAWRKGALSIERARQTLGYAPKFDIYRGIEACLAEQRL